MKGVSFMHVDPRTMKALLQAQLAPSLSFGAGAKKEDGGAASVFDTILSSQLAAGASATDPEQQAAAGQPVWTGGNGIWAQIAQLYSSEAAGWLNANAAEAAAGSAGLTGAAAPYADIIGSAAAKYGVDARLVAAVIATESGFNPLAQSRAGAKGLMQLMDGTARGLGVTDSFDPVQNVEGGTQYLSLLLRKYGGNELVALAAYNAGPGRVDRLGIATDEELVARLGELPEETQRYVAKVQQAKL